MIDRLTLTTKFENGDFTTQNTTFDMIKLVQDSVQTFSREEHRTFDHVRSKRYVPCQCRSYG